MTRLRHAVAEKMRRWADRLDYPGAPKSIGWSFTFERGRGIVFHEGRDKGCPLWYLRDDHYDLAYDRATDPPPQIHWETMTLRHRYPWVDDLLGPEKTHPVWRNASDTFSDVKFPKGDD